MWKAMRFTELKLAIESYQPWGKITVERAGESIRSRTFPAYLGMIVGPRRQLVWGEPHKGHARTS